MKRLALAALAVVVAATVTSCSDSGPATPPALDRIDGPAEVDPSFDPFATTPSSAPSSLLADDGG